MNIKITNPLGVIFTVLLVVAAFLAGNRIGTRNNSGLPTNDKQVAVAPTVAPQPPQLTTATVSIENDAVLGDKTKAKVAIVEFSDYECPFCKRFQTDTMGQIQKNYIDTGKAILVFRDLPLPFHDPAATKDAMAAECARSLGTDKTYYQMHDLIFETTPGNGGGITEDKLAELAGKAGVNKAKFSACLKAETFKSEIEKDKADASAAGISGTPGFVVGPLGADGSVTGKIISGAYPYATFSEAIDVLLK